ncbi:MAG: GspE/PulE family protein [Candidatus Omnitrophica bacterium]|nr:GspE/PulE family protein [Candidatus Omnitrophota bacterium]
MSKLGDLLMQKNLITAAQLQAAIEESRRRGEAIGKTLIRLGFINDAQLLSVLGQQLGMPFCASLKDRDVAPAVIAAVPFKFVWHYKIMPLALADKVLTIAVSDPMEIWSMEDLKLHLGFSIERVLATEKEILSAIRQYYGFGAETVADILTQQAAAAPRPRAESAEIEDLGKDTPQDRSVITLVNQLLSEAINARATDVHLEPFRDQLRVRQRIDGVLYNMNLPEQAKYLIDEMVSRIKILAGLNVVEKRLPQDGRAIVRVGERQADLRVSVIPALYGEGVVIRILPVNRLFDVTELGFFPEDLRLIGTVLQRPHGILFLTGPTGSGKTTTLYAFLNQLNKESVKIITVEDPVEYELKGIMQIPVRPDIGFTFGQALRSILRHDPDIMMIGEVRDFDTAELAIRMALTGHQILSTLHSNDAAGGAPRLLDIGIEPYLVASSVNAFLSQRLVRRICPECRREHPAQDKLPEIFRQGAVFQGKGCEACGAIGYRGRTVIYEILTVTDSVQELILQKASSVRIEQQALREGFRPLREIGVAKVRQGITTPEEVVEVTQW